MANPHQHGSGGLCSECMEAAKMTDADLGESLYPTIDQDRMVCLNEANGNNGSACIKVESKRLEPEPFVVSNEDDPELILHVPFTCQNKVRSFCVVGGGLGTAPTHVKIFINRDDIDFDNASDLPATQEFNLAEDLNGEIYYPVKAHKFQSVHSMTFFFTESGNGDQTRIDYLDIKGVSTDIKKHRAVAFVYEARAQLQDHETPAGEGGAAHRIT